MEVFGATDTGVVINGVRWATRNVSAASRSFAHSPESFGGLFIWSQRNACPPGWRLPWRHEFESLANAGSVWYNKNGSNGRLFGTYPYQIFLPAAGSINWWTDNLNDRNVRGAYYVDGLSNIGTFDITVSSASANIHGNPNSFNAFSVRCVAI